MDRISPDTLSRVERAIEAEVRAAGAGNLSDVGGVEAAADILDLAGRSVEKQTLDALRQKDPALAEEIQARRFGFEDLALLDNKALQAVLKRVDRRDLLLALKAAEERIAGKILESFSPSERSEMQKAGKEMGVVRFSEVEAAQRRIVNVMCTLADSGSIKLGRGEESP
jgi:flagellar motor switch protein FliG